MANYTFIFLVLITLLCSCQGDSPAPEIAPPDTTTTATETVEPVEQNYSIELLEGENGWGYNILLNGKAFIRQPNIPAIPGNQGFDSKEKAQKTADFVLNKIKNGIMPPSTSKEELENLGVL